MTDLSGKKALITGSTGGIGAEIARVLHGAGAHVFLSGTRQGVLDELAGELGERASVYPANLMDQSGAEQLAAAVNADGGVDILVNNAGVTRDNLAMRMKDEDFDAVLRVNLQAAFQLSRAFLRSMMKNRWGRIVNVTSVVGHTGNPGQTNYCAAKAGLTGLTKALAAEVASRGITVNCVAPGFIVTPMTDALTDAQKEAITNNIPAGVLGTPVDVAGAVRYLAGDEAGYVTGQTLHVNGGLAMI